MALKLEEKEETIVHNLLNLTSLLLINCSLHTSEFSRRLTYVPKHTSWLNQIECWFSILMRRLLKRGNFTSTDDLKRQILDFISYFNRTLAKPFKWKFEGYSEVA